MWRYLIAAILVLHGLVHAIAFVQRNKAALTGIPVWLFSSGPVANQEGVDPVELGDLEATIAIREHKLFSGAVKLDQMSFTERLMAKAMKVTGDYREWPAIDAWADEVRTELRIAQTTSAA